DLALCHPAALLMPKEHEPRITRITRMKTEEAEMPYLLSSPSVIRVIRVIRGVVFVLLLTESGPPAGTGSTPAAPGPATAGAAPDPRCGRRCSRGCCRPDRGSDPAARSRWTSAPCPSS